MALLTREQLQKIRHIQIETTHLADEILAGAYRSAFKGQGMEFAEVREYLPGDDVRSIDWNVTARMDRPFIKTFEEERELTVLLLVDLSASTRFGSASQTKRDFIAEIGGVFAFSAIKNQDKVGLVLFSNVIEKFIPPKKGNRHGFRVIRELLAYDAHSRGTNIALALNYLGNIQRKSCICFLISDFMDSAYQHDLMLAAKKHDLICLHIQDPMETHFPEGFLLHVTDLEGDGETFIDTSSPYFSSAFEEQFEQHSHAIQKLCEKVGAGYLPLRTDQPFLPVIKTFFRMRRERRG